MKARDILNKVSVWTMANMTVVVLTAAILAAFFLGRCTA